MAGILEVILLFMGIGAMGSVGITFFLFNPYRYVVLLRRMTGRNYGIVSFVTKGQAMFPVIKNFDKDIVRTRKGIWFFQAGKIYRQVAAEGKDNKIKTEHHYTFKPEDIQFRSGVPMVFLDVDDMFPKKLVSEQFENEPKSRNPYQVEAALGKEIAAAEREAITMTKKNIQIMLIVVAVLVIVSIGVSAMAFDNTNKIGSMVFNLTQRIPSVG